EPEWLVPFDGKQQCARLRKHLLSRVSADFAEIVHEAARAPEQRFQLDSEILVFAGMHFGGHFERHIRAPRNLDGKIGPLLRHHSTEKKQIRTTGRLEVELAAR